MSFCRDISNFASEALSEIESLKEQQRIDIENELVKFLGAEDAAKIVSYKFDDYESKFYDLEAPDYIISRFKAENYLKDC